MQQVSCLSDDALLHELHALVGSHRRVTAELILHLGEVDARRLHVERGFPSLFCYCVDLLRVSEDEACRRIEAARLARRFPAIHPLLETGEVSLTVLGLLKPHITDDNHRTLLAGVSRSSVRKAKEWLAARFPRPDLPSTIRKLPERSPARAMPPLLAVAPASPAASVSATESARDDAERIHGGAAPAPTRVTRVEPVSQDRLFAVPSAPTQVARVEPVSSDRLLAAPPAAVSPASGARARVEPLSQNRFLVKLTVSRALREKLELASDLMRHANPNGDLAVVLERAVDLLIAELEKKKQGRTSRPRREPRKNAFAAMRLSAKETYVARAARREVVASDGWRCSFVAEDGRRCDAQGFLEFDHKTPKGCGGGSRAENLRLLCRAHNRLAAERVYGKAHVSRAISASREHRRKD